MKSRGRSTQRADANEQADSSIRAAVVWRTAFKAGSIN